MNPIEELELIITLIKKYNLPLSPILEYAIKEKEEHYKEGSIIKNSIPIIREDERELGIKTLMTI